LSKPATSLRKSKACALLFEDIHQRASQLLKQAGFKVKCLPATLNEAGLARRLSGVTILGIRSKTKVGQAVLSKAGDLLALGAFCVGTNQIDLDSASERGVVVFNAPFSNTRSVVELAAGEIIMLMRRVFDVSSKLHKGRWSKSSAGCFEVRGKKLGIIGYGNIGAQLSVLAEALGMEVYYYDSIERLALGNARKTHSLPELLQMADVVSVHVDGRRANVNLIDEAEFRLMKQGAFFLNLSRGSVVNLKALAGNLRNGHIAGAAVDVYPYEPEGNNQKFSCELAGLPNVILTPHIGGNTMEAQKNSAEYVTARLVDYINSGKTVGSVNFPELDLPGLKQAHRLLHIHHNVPGILAKINGILAEERINILGQYLKTNDKIGYVITDVDRKYDRSVIEKLRSVPETIRFRVLY